MSNEVRAMSKGTPVKTIRIAQELLDVIEQALRRTKPAMFEGDDTLTTYILDAIKQRLNHLQRAKKSGKKPKKPESVVQVFKCEECSQNVTYESAGQISRTPCGDCIAICWRCLIYVGPFRPTVTNDE